jgi:diguanylate cyclase (GGDEF)-like protein
LISLGSRPDVGGASITAPYRQSRWDRALAACARSVRLPAAARGVVSWLGRLRPGAAVALAMGATMCVAVGDEVTGADVSFTLLYLGPIAFATWFVSLCAGVSISVVAAIASFGVDLAVRTVPLGRAVLAWNFAVQLGTFLALVLVLGALKDRLATEAQLARTDALTLVSNRRAFLELAGVELERARRTGAPIAIAYLDCDDFKFINDRLGHAEGDSLLAAVAATLRRATRVADTVARLGGDEFGLLLVDADATATERLVARLRGALAAVMAANGWAVTFSIGAATFLVPPRSVDEMLAHADVLMYDAKRGGKDTARVEVVPDVARLRLAAS